MNIVLHITMYITRARIKPFTNLYISSWLYVYVCFANRESHQQWDKIETEIENWLQNEDGSARENERTLRKFVD